MTFVAKKYTLIFTLLDIIVLATILFLKQCSGISKDKQQDYVDEFTRLSDEFDDLVSSQNEFQNKIDGYKYTIIFNDSIIIALTDSTNDLRDKLLLETANNSLSYSDLVELKKLIEEIRWRLIILIQEFEKSSLTSGSFNGAYPEQNENDEYQNRRISELNDSIADFTNRSVAVLNVQLTTLNKRNELTYIDSEIDKLIIEINFDPCYFTNQKVYLYLINPQNAKVAPFSVNKKEKVNNITVYSDGSRLVLDLEPETPGYLQESEVKRLQLGFYHIELYNEQNKYIGGSEPIEIVPKN